MGFRPCCFRVSDLGFALRHVSCSAEFKGALERALRALTPSSASLRTGTLSISQSSQSVSDFKLPFTPSKLCLPPKDARYPRARAVLKRMCLFPHRVRLLIASGGLCLGRACSTLLCAQPVAGCSCFTMSLAVRQMHRRVSNAARWPRRWQAVRLLPAWQHRARVDMLALQCDVMGALFDSLLGLCLALALWIHLDLLCEKLCLAHCHVSDSYEQVVTWLMGVDPGGLKLNENLNSAIGGCVMCLLQLWRAVLRASISMLPPPRQLALVLWYSCPLGASFCVAIGSDLLALYSLHVVQLYRVITFCFAGYMSALRTLFNLFRGRKLNVLRQRVDSCDSDHEQLLLGILLFIVLVVLWPIVAAYYGLATIVRAALLCAHVLLMALVLILDGFPWFDLVKYVVRPTWLQEGVRFQALHHVSAPGGVSMSYFAVLPQAASIVPFLAWFHALWALLIRGCSAKKIARLLLFGDEIQMVSDSSLIAISAMKGDAVTDPLEFVRSL
ncbi:MAG: hypothetical protein SGPRY_006385 [Prymnesium sp.]